MDKSKRSQVEAIRNALVYIQQDAQEAGLQMAERLIGSTIEELNDTLDNDMDLSNKKENLDAGQEDNVVFLKS